MPKVEPKYPKPEEAKALYLASEHYSWYDFATNQGWNPESTRKKYPIPQWTEEKVKLQEAQFGSEFTAMQSQQSELWYRQVHKTIKEYPELIDSAMQILKYRSNQYLKIIQNDLKNGTNKFNNVPTKALNSLTHAIKSLTEAKYEALLLSELKIKEFSSTPEGGERIVFEVMGAGSVKELKKMAHEWNNKN